MLCCLAHMHRHRTLKQRLFIHAYIDPLMVKSIYSMKLINNTLLKSLPDKE